MISYSRPGQVPLMQIIFKLSSIRNDVGRAVLIWFHATNTDMSFN